jgi:hypothetical protein
MANNAKKHKIPIKQRTREEIDAEYKQLCQVCGDRSYRVAVLKSELDNIHKRIFDINQEASKIVPQPAAKTMPPVELVKEENDGQ